jgi:5-methylcytosine-specific restriction endonuclease McrA
MNRLRDLIDGTVVLRAAMEGDDAKLRRMLLHPSRSRAFRSLKETSCPRMGKLLLLVFPDQFRQCRDCYVVYQSTAEYFGHTSNGNLRRQCKKCRAANTRKWYQNNREKVFRRVSEYNARRSVAGPHPTEGQLLALRSQQDDCCAYCGVELKGGGELDHRVSLLAGGANSIENRSWVCLTCNRDKSSKSVEEFMAWRRSRGLSVNEGGAS